MSKNFLQMPIFGHMYFGHTSAIFRPIGLNYFMGTQETIFIILSIDWREIQIMVLIFILCIFCPLLVGKWAWPLYAPRMVCDPKPSQKVGSLGLLGQPQSRNHIFEILNGQ